MSQEFKKVIVCRSANESLTPGAKLGYECAICQEPLQITASGRETLRSSEGSVLLCNPCGLLYVHLAEGAGALAGTETSPEAKAQLDSGNNTGLAKWMRKRGAPS